MRCRMSNWMIFFVASSSLILAGCASLRDLQPGAINSFCSTYQRVITAKGDGTITATRAVKQRLAANEVTFRRECEGVQVRVK